MPDVISGPSGGALGDNSGLVSRDLFEKHPDLARQIVTIGQYKRAGHDRERWKTVNWDDYRAKVGVQQSAGPWRIKAIESVAGDVTSWVAEAEGMPVTPPGWYTALMHAERGLIMSDVPGEIAGALPFLDYCARPGFTGRVLIAGLGLGILPAWLLTRTAVRRIDIAEIDADVIKLTTGGCDQDWAPNAWAADPRLHIYHDDIHTWRPPADAYWDACFHDIWDLISPANLPSMRRLTRRFARRRKGPVWSWERPECEAMRARGQTLERPSCLFISETGYPAAGEPEEALHG